MRPWEWTIPVGMILIMLAFAMPHGIGPRMDLNVDLSRGFFLTGLGLVGIGIAVAGYLRRRRKRK